jgi:ABC-type proline/glycine betaine transport system permease subunit
MVWWGFDSFVIMVMALTAYFIARRSIWVILTASSLGTCLFIDCWFDILTSRHGRDLLQSIMLALFVELPVAIISWYFAINTAQQYTKNNL